MSQPEKRPKVKLDARVSPELKEKVRQHQEAKGMKEISEAIIDLIERGLLLDTEYLNLQTCVYLSQIPSKFGSFINCKRPIHQSVIGRGSMPDRPMIVCKQVQQCLACQLYDIIRVPLTNKERIEDEIADKKEELDDLLLKIKDAQRENPIHVKVEANPPLIKRVIEEKKTTEDYMPPQEQKKHADILCPKAKDFVSVEDACKKCDGIVDCREYGEYVYLRPMKKQ